MDTMTIVDPLGLGRRAWRVGEDTVLSAADHLVALAIRRGLVQRVVEELLADGVVDQVIERLLAGPELEQVAARVLDSPGAERLVAQALDSRLVDASVTRVLASRELWLVVEEIARSPAVTEAISHQGAGFADQVVGQVGDGTRRADAWLERAARRMMHRAPAAPEPLAP
jgi:hypothetical protein